MSQDSQQNNPARMLAWAKSHSENPCANRYIYSVDQSITDKSNLVPGIGMINSHIATSSMPDIWNVSVPSRITSDVDSIAFNSAAPSSMVGGDSNMPNENDFMKYIDLLDKDRRDMEKRLTDDRKESEQRIASYIEKLNDKIDKVSEKIDQQKDDNVKSNREHRAWSIATIIAIAGLVVAAFYGTAQIVVSILQK